MDRDQLQARDLLAHKIADEATIRQAYNDPRRSPEFDLCSVLEAQHRITAQQAQWIRSQSVPANAHDLTVMPPTQLNPSGAAFPPVGTGTRRDGGAAFAELLSSSGALQPGQQLGPFRIVRKIAQGGMGVVYEALHTQLNQTVALKTILNQGDINEEMIERFEIEAQAMARLNHPNIVRVIDVEILDRAAYMAMEFIQGGSLKDAIAKAPLSAERAAELSASMAEALHHAHSRSIVHRDMKPANVLISTDGQAKITDFGIAKSTKGERNLTKTGDMIGTPAYMPPEQVDGTGFIDGRSDVYSLGATLYEMLTGRPPFDGNSTINIVSKVLKDEPVPPSRYLPELDQDLETICLKCLEKNPDDRYLTAEHLAADLRAFLKDEAIQARPPNFIERIQKWIRRNRALTSAIVLMSIMSLLSLLMLGFYSYKQISDALTDAKIKEQAAIEAKKAETAALQRVKRSQSRVLMQAKMERGYAFLKADRPLDAARVFAEAVEEFNGRLSDFEGPLNDAEEALLDACELAIQEAIGRNLLLRQQTVNGGRALAISPDSNLVAVVSRREDTCLLRILDLDSGRERLRFERKGRDIGDLIFDPLSEKLYLAWKNNPKQAEIECIDLNSKATLWRQVLDSAKGFAHQQLLIDPSGRYLVTNNTRAVLFLDRETGRPRERAPAAFDTMNRRLSSQSYITPISSIDFSTDGQILVTSHPDGTVSTWDIPSGRFLAYQNLASAKFTLVFPPYLSFQSIATPVNSPEFLRVLTANREGRLHLWDLSATNSQRRFLSHRVLGTQYGQCLFLQKQLRNNIVMAGYGVGLVALWHTSGQLYQTIRHPGLSTAKISADGHTLITLSSSELRTWNINCTRLLNGHSPVQFFDDDQLVFVERKTHENGRNLRAPLRSFSVLFTERNGERQQTIQLGHHGNQFIKNLTPLPSRDCLLLDLHPPYDSQRIKAGLYLLNTKTTLTKKVFKPRLVLEGRIVRSVSSSDNSRVVVSFRAEEAPGRHAAHLYAVEMATDTVTKMVWHHQRVKAMVFRKKNSQLISGALDGTLAIWSFPAKAEAITPDTILFPEHRLSRQISNFEESYEKLFHKREPVKKIMSNQLVQVHNKFFPEIKRAINYHNDQVQALALDDSERLLFIGTGDGDIYVWDFKESRFRKNLTLHNGSIIGLHMVLNNRVLISCSSDSTIAFWDWRQGRVLRRIQLSSMATQSTLSPDKKTLIVATDEGRLWCLTPDLPELPGFRKAPIQTVKTVLNQGSRKTRAQ